MAYTRGNLAVKEKTSARGQALPKYKETTKVVTRRAPLPVAEKLLYLLTVVFCVAVASVLVWQNAHVYDLKYKIHRADNDVKNLNKQMSVLEVKKQQLEEEIPKAAKALGASELKDEAANSKP
ncbi:MULTISPECIES: hypothetical protein [Paenibacillus]|uniref:hypothetical protein n=1 Tax=Paenibacillus TaxID=44249 RepID=UPI0008386DBB|nr:MULTISPECIES: hypothetical protein [Paenibacillus]GIP20484.1 hypothetical protein J22TS3_07590 [Paenibacillus sp. J22TS3]